MGAKEDSANWDGESINLNMGHKLFYPLVSADIAAHELAHGMVEVSSSFSPLVAGVTSTRAQMASGLEYTGESGGLNEAFADMYGKVVETHVFGREKPNDWKIGDDVFKKVPTPLLTRPDELSAQ